MILLLLPLLLISNIGFVYSNCVNINNNNSLTVLNSTFNQDCYNHVIQEIDCCNYFLLNDKCIKLQKCIDQKFIIDGLTKHCHEHNTEIFDLNFQIIVYFTIHLEPYCMKIYIILIVILVFLVIHDKNNITKTCNIPTK